MIQSRSLANPTADTRRNGALDQSPPYAEEAEWGILGSMLVSPRETIPECIEKINEEYFYAPPHRTIYNALVDLWNAGQAIDLITFTQALRDKNLLESVGGAAFVTSLFTFVPCAANVGYYIDIVREMLTRRKIIRICAEQARRCFEIEGEDSAALLSDVEQQFEAIRHNGRNGDLPEGVPLMTLAECEPDSSKTLLGNRFLCRDGGMIFVGSSGIGKSSASAQQDILWALGRPAFGIKPSRPLRILCIQAENDNGDLSEIANGICDRLNLGDEERELVRKNVIYVSDCSHTGESFLQMAARLLEKYGPFDLLRIDTLHAYLGGDILDVEFTSRFLRNGLNPILKKFGCAVIVNHHTPKPTNRDTSNWRASDWMYSGAGNADVTNWCRAALVINSTHAPDIYEFHAAKRGKRIGWCDENGQTIYTRLFCWDKGEAIYWRDATAEDVERVELSKPQAATKRGKPQTKEDLKALVPPDGSVAKNVLISWAQARGIGVKRSNGFLSELIEAGELFEWGEKRSRTRPELRISRHERKLI